MTNPICRSAIFLVGAALLAVPACGTEEFGPTPVTVAGTMPEAGKGGLLIAWAPRDATEAEAQARAPTSTAEFVHVFIDRSQLAFDVLGTLEPAYAYEWGEASGGYLPAGPHHIEIKGAGGHRTIFAGDGEIPEGSLTRLYLYGPADAVQGRFVSYPEVPAPGAVHVSLINLVRTGVQIELVGCANPSDCAPLSGPLALGETFDADLPLDAVQDWPGGRYVLSNGVGLGFRQTPTAALPAPPVQPVAGGMSLYGSAPPLISNLVAAPFFVSAQGDFLSFD
jgi:hypothetical protein